MAETIERKIQGVNIVKNIFKMDMIANWVRNRINSCDICTSLPRVFAR